jgi:hypothetical protein
LRDRVIGVRGVDEDGRSSAFTDEVRGARVVAIREDDPGHTFERQAIEISGRGLDRIDAERTFIGRHERAIEIISVSLGKP